MHGTILLERSLPLGWSVPQEVPRALAEHHNHLVFALLDKLEEPSSYHKSDSGLADELIRIEAKLNIIMQLLGQLQQQRQSPLPARLIRFTSDTLAWQVGDEMPAQDSLLQVSLYPDDSIPLAITFLAQVKTIDSDWVEVDMQGLDEDERAMWSRWVFRQHRRQVALARTPPNV